MEEWMDIPEFPEYAVSTLGRVQRLRTGRIMKLSRNQRGVIMVGMMKDGMQHKRSVPILVANAFLDRPRQESFDSVIHLNGDRDDCSAVNLMWRPHWFVVQYHRQFFYPGLKFNCRIYCPQTEEFFNNSLEMAVTYGLLERQIVEANVNGHMIWPTKFEVLVYD